MCNVVYYPFIYLFCVFPVMLLNLEFYGYCYYVLFYGLLSLLITGNSILFVLRENQLNLTQSLHACPTYQISIIITIHVNLTDDIFIYIIVLDIIAYEQ